MFTAVGTLSTFTRFNFFVWFTLAFQAGLINAGGFLAGERYVSHITGSITQFNVELALIHFNTAWVAIMVPISFFIGILYSGYMIDQKIQKNQKPLYHFVFFSIALFLLIVSVLGYLDMIGPFGQLGDSRAEFILVSLLSFICGMQNATVTTASGAVVRTTHLTGLFTDLGIGMIRLLCLDYSEHTHKKQHEVLALKFRIGLIGFFGLGAYLGAYLFQKLHYLGFLIPCTLSILLYFTAKIKFKFLRIG